MIDVIDLRATGRVAKGRGANENERRQISDFVSGIYSKAAVRKNGALYVRTRSMPRDEEQVKWLLIH